MSQKILIVDNESYKRMNIRDILAKDGYREIYETYGEEAVAQYTELHPDLVFMELSLHCPNSLDLLSTIISINRKANIIMISNGESENDIIKAVTLGARDIIIRPFSNQKLLDVVSNTIGKPLFPASE